MLKATFVTLYIAGNYAGAFNATIFPRSWARALTIRRFADFQSRWHNQRQRSLRRMYTRTVDLSRGNNFAKKLGSLGVTFYMLT